MAPSPLLTSISQAWTGNFSSVGWLTNNPSKTREVVWDGVSVTWNKKAMDKIVADLKAAEADLLRLNDLPGLIVNEEVKKLIEVVVFCVGLLVLRGRRQLEIIGKGEREDAEVDEKLAGAIGDIVEDAFVVIREMLGRPRVV